MKPQKYRYQLAVVLCWPMSLCALTAAARAQGVPEDLWVIKAGRVITVSGEEFAPGIVVIEDGKITGVGSGIEYPPGARVIDASNETVMPGFVHPRSRHGLSSYRRTGVRGDWKTSSEVFLSQLRFDDLLESGYTAISFVPDGTDIPGVASVYRTAGPDDQRLLLESAFIRVYPDWSSNGKENLRAALKKAKDEIEKVKKARDEWEKKQKEKTEQKKKEESQEPKPEETPSPTSSPSGLAKLPPEQIPGAEKKEEDKFEPPPIDPKYRPLVDLIEKKEGARLLVELNKASDLHHLDDVLKQYDGITPFLYLWTGLSADYHHVVETLGERKAEVMLLPRIFYLPETTFRYNLVKELAAAGCKVSASPAWGDDRDGYLSIRERLADLVRAGLSREDALKALTLHPATAIGLGKRLGSIEKDKDADLVFLNGDPLDPHNKVTRVMILGELVWKAEKNNRTYDEPRTSVRANSLRSNRAHGGPPGDGEADSLQKGRPRS